MAKEVSQKLLDDLVIKIELHDVEGIRNCFVQGIDPNMNFRGEPLIYELTSEYARTHRFKECVKVFVDHGLQFDDKSLLTVLLDDADGLSRLLDGMPELVKSTYSLRCAYTPMHEVTLLHICAEFNHPSCAKVLVEHGADIDARAGIDSYGFGGQTPIFHTVNQNQNNSMEMMDFLLAQGVDLSTAVKGILWGESYPWETLLPAVNPISYAMFGLLPQMHRDERTISQVVSKLLKHHYGLDYRAQNIPNRYLQGN